MQLEWYNALVILFKTFYTPWRDPIIRPRSYWFKTYTFSHTYHNLTPFQIQRLIRKFHRGGAWTLGCVRFAPFLYCCTTLFWWSANCKSKNASAVSRVHLPHLSITYASITLLPWIGSIACCSTCSHHPKTVTHLSVTTCPVTWVYFAGSKRDFYIPFLFIDIPLHPWLKLIWY